MCDILKFILSDFWVFVGFIIVLTTMNELIKYIWESFWGYLNVWKHGYPPEHCDSLGNNIKSEKK